MGKHAYFDIRSDAKRQKSIYVTNKQLKGSDLLRQKDLLVTESEVNDINKTLNKLILDIDLIERTFQFNKETFSSQMVMEKLKLQKGGVTKKADDVNFLFEFMDQYILDHQSTREAGSLTVYRSVKNHLQAYEIASRQKVSFETIDYNFFNRFQTFLIKRVKIDKSGAASPMLNNTTIAKALSTLKTFLGYAKRQNIPVNDNYRTFTIKKEKLEVIALDQTELDAIIELDLSSNPRLDKTRSLFVFACATGLRYSDCAQLKRQNITDGLITITVKKTKTELTIPLNSISAAILDKYKDQVSPLPIISNQNLNYNIKDLCKLARIDTPIEIVRYNGKTRNVTVYPKYELCHFHTGRKTFVTLSLEKGMSAEEVMEISGHSDYRSFKRYVRVTERRKKVVMLKAWGEVPHLKVV